MTKRARQRQRAVDDPRLKPGQSASSPGLAGDLLLRTQWPIALGIFLAALLLYAPTFTFGLVIWDDVANVRDNPFLQPFSLKKLAQFWIKPYGDLYVPLVYTSYAIELAVSGGATWIMHVTNALLHAGSAVLVFLLALRFINVPWAAAVGALLFAMHPLAVEPVSWVTGRKDVLSGFFSFLALLLFLRWRDGGGWIKYSAAIVSLILALLAKPAAVAVPLIAVCIDLIGLRTALRRSLAALAPWFILAALWTLATTQAQPISVHVPLWRRPFIAADALLFYVSKILVPWGLAPTYQRSPWDLDKSWVPYAAVVVITVLSIALRKMGRIGWVAGGIFVSGVLPVLGLKQFRYQNYSTVADRYVYLSMLGVALGIAGMLVWVESRTHRRRVLMGVAGVVIAILAGLTFRQQRIWRSSEAIARAMVAANPQSGPGHNLLAVELFKQGRIDEVITINRKSLALLKHPFAYNNLAYSLQKKAGTVKGEESRRLLVEAEQLYEQAVKMDPTMSEAIAGLGMTQMRLGKVAAAVPNLAKAAQLSPDKSQPRVNLGLALMQLKRPAEAATYLEQAWRMEFDPTVGAYLAEAWLLAGEKEKAAAVLREAEIREPTNAEVVRVKQRLGTSG